MYIIASFTHSIYLELAITAMEKSGIPGEKILAVPLDKRAEKRKIFDTINQSDGVSLFDLATVSGTIFMLLGAIYGFTLKWGPIIWGLIGMISGAILGLIADIIPKERGSSKKRAEGKTAEVFLMIACNKNQAEIVEKILWDNLALGTARLERSSAPAISSGPA